MNDSTQSPADDSLVMLSDLQHYLFCRRQGALSHLEQSWAENRLTASGRVLHERVDERKSETRWTLRQATAVRLISHRLGVGGVADMVEFHLVDAECAPDETKVAARLPGIAGFGRPFPVEYKRDKPKSHRTDEVQLCAQAICLEEMLGVAIPAGALFYGEPRRRTDVTFDAELRGLTEEVAHDVQALIVSGETPPPTFDKWCASCSLIEECRPKLLASHRSARAWLEREMETAEPWKSSSTPSMSSRKVPTFVRRPFLADCYCDGIGCESDAETAIAFY